MSKLSPMKKFYFIIVVFCFQIFNAAAADISGPAELGSDLGTAKSHIEKKDWSGAIAVLEKFVKANPNNADGFNLLGYSLRNNKRYPEAIFNYKEALRIDPNHRGAHEYLGQAYVQTKQLDKAKELLASLEKICGTQCEEYIDLKKAIAKFKK
jgi:tetratricopeptide (TPR) repeat protein